MKTRVPGDILLFGGQGSHKHLSDRSTVLELEKHLGEANSLFKLFLKQCLAAFHVECECLNENERTVLGRGPTQFYEDTEALLFPCDAVRSHPVAETISLYLLHILELVAYAAESEVRPRVVEVTGICTGLVPAVLAASTLSFESPEFLASAVHGFRLVFWVGLRSAYACRDLLGEQPSDSAWVLSTFGWPTDQVEKALAEFRSQKDQELDHIIQISAIFGNDVHSLSGPGHILADFKSTTIPTSIQCRTAHVHGFYHGGSRMNGVVAQVLHDVESRRVNFPTWDALHAPLRSSTTGDRITKESGNQSLLETVLRSIFVEACDWKQTCENIFDEAVQHLAHDLEARYRVLCVGPNTRSLVQGAPTHDRITIIGNPEEIIEENMENRIAIIGMSINYPGANSIEQLWDMVEKAQCTASKIPSSRFNIPAKLGDKYGNFLDDPFQFDSGFFNISPREAKSMDPQQRLLLQAAFEALEDSGYSPDSTSTFRKDSFGVFVGVATNDYVDNLRKDIDVYYSPGTLRAFLSGRVSYAFDFLGPSIVVDTACSSSMIALYQACQAIQSGECTAALAGGVNTISSPDMYTGLARAHFLSPTGQCKPFDAAADGYCRSEGCGLVVVKKLSSAIEENDNIYGIIRGIAVNQCGTAKSITHPDHRTQATLFKRLLKSSRTAPDTVNVVEAHGTGTQAGDLAEVLSLGNTFGLRSASNPLHLSSIKGNIGHAEAASGIAGIAKLLAMIQKGKIPPQASFNSLNPRLTDHIQNMVVPKQLTTWNPLNKQYPRRAMLNNFGAAGSNSALILEEYTPKIQANSGMKELSPSRSHHILNLSAKSEKALQFLKDRFITYIETHPKIDANDLCYSTNARRQAYTGFRLSITGSDSSQLASSLRQSSFTEPGSFEKGTQKTIFVFSGQGHVYKGMGAELLSTVPEFRLVVQKCDKILSQNGFPVVHPFLSNSPDLDMNEYIKDEIVITQCALFVLEFALARSWIQWGLTPSIVVGHSIGEYAAMAIAGVWDIENALLLIAKRAQLIAKHVHEGSGMVTCRTTADEIRSILTSDDRRFSGISIACINSHEDIVVAGSAEPLTHFIEYCKDNAIRAKRLSVPYGFHSSCMDPILGDLESHVSTIELRQGNITIGSSLRGKLLNSDEKLQPEYFVQHTRNCVDFYHVIKDIERSLPGSNLEFIEVGPFPSTESMIRRTIAMAPYTFLPSLRPTQSPWETLSQSLSSLFLRNHPVKWREVYRGSSAKFLTSLPKYPMNPSRYYVRFQELEDKKTGFEVDPPKTTFEFLGSAKPNISKDLVTFHANLGPLAPYIKAHSVAGVPLCPASVLIEVVLEAFSIHQEVSSTSLHLLVDTVFEKPLVYDDQMANDSGLQAELGVSAGKETPFSISSEDQIHCSGRIARKSPIEVVDIFTRKSAFVKRQRRTLYQDSATAFDSFSPRTIYQVIFPRVVAYEKPFLTLKQLSVSESRLEGCGTLQLDSSLLQDRFVSHPVFMDTMLHAPGFIANIYVPANVACICVSIERSYLPATQQLRASEMTIYCSLTDVGHSVIADAYIIDSDENVLAFIEGSHFKKIPLKSFNNHLSRSLRASVQKPLPIEAPQPTRKALLPPLSQIEETIQSIVRDCCGVFLGPSSKTTLAEAGVDSLMRIEIAGLIRNRLPQIEIDDASLENCSTLKELTNIVSKASVQKSLLKIPIPGLTRENSPVTQDVTLPPTPPNDLEVLSPMKSLLFDTCGIEIEAGMMNLTLATLGVDSLLSIELSNELRERFGLVIDESQYSISELTFNRLEEIFTAHVRTPNGLQASTGTSSHDAIPTPETVALSPKEAYDFQRKLQRQIHGPKKCTVYLFHDGSGHCSMYSRMSNMNRSITGIFSPDPSVDVGRIEDLATLYIKRTKLDKEQEVLLGGWSFGGVLAFEVARQLQSLGRTVKGLILVDSPPPVDHKALPLEVISHIVDKNAPNKTTHIIESSKQARERIKQRFQYHAALLQQYHPEPHTVPCVMLKCSHSMDTEMFCNVTYPWLSDNEFRANSVTQWEYLVGRSIPVLDIACNHFQVFDADYVGEVSEKIMLACEMLDGNVEFRG